MEKLGLLLEGAHAARDKVGPEMNRPEAHLANREWVAVETIIDEKVVREIIPLLKGLGAEGICGTWLRKYLTRLRAFSRETMDSKCLRTSDPGRRQRRLSL